MKLHIELNMNHMDLDGVKEHLGAVNHLLGQTTSKFVQPGLHDWFKLYENSSVMVVPYEVILDCFELMEAYKNSGYEVDEDNQVVAINNQTGRCIVKDMINDAYHVGTIHLKFKDDKLCAEIESDQGDDENTYSMNVYA